MTVFESLMETKTRRGGGFFLLLDPDRSPLGKMLALAEAAEESGVDAILVGSSLTISSGFDETISEIKRVSSIPVIIFPGTHSQISSHADAILFTSLISGRNPAYLIDEQVKGAPLIKEYGLEPIATGYLLIESGRVTSVQYISNTLPIPADKNDIACAHALAAKYMGMNMIFMEAGSGAERAVPESMIKAVDSYVELPIIIGGGIRRPEEVRRRITAGASFVVVGNHFEDNSDIGFLREFAQAAHPLDLVTV
jgi:putative glycerol-1-phosphate prenyltransferase